MPQNELVRLWLVAWLLVGGKCSDEEPVYPFDALVENEEWSTSFIIVMALCLFCIVVLSALVVYRTFQSKEEQKLGETKVAETSKAVPPAPAKSFFSSLFGNKESSIEAQVKKTTNPVLKPVVCYADVHMKTEFKSEKHRKYHANVYYQSGTLSPMVDADRRNSSKLAYQSFTNGLADISQRYPIENEHIGTGVKGKTKEELAKIGRQAKWERLIQDRFATDCTCRFKERLKFRTKAYYELKSKALAGKPVEFDPFHYGGIPIRKDTQMLLCRPPEVKNSLMSMLSVTVTILVYVSVLWGNISTLWSLSPNSKVLFHIAGLDITPNRLLFGIFIFKECMFITIPLIVAFVGGIAIACSPVALVLYLFRHRRDKARRAMLLVLWKETIKPMFEDNLKLLKSFINALSTLRAIRNQVESLIRRECNASLKDFDMILLDLANLTFSVAVLLAGAEHGGELIQVSNMTSIPITMAKLLKAFVAQRLVLNRVYQSLKDVNENRLSKFELALLLTKYTEILLSEEVQYNFVQHFATSLAEDPLEPDVAPMPYHEERDRERLLRNMPPLPLPLALEFGHDMLGEYKDHKGPAVPYHSGLAAVAAAAATASTATALASAGSNAATGSSSTVASISTMAAFAGIADPAPRPEQLSVFSSTHTAASFSSGAGHRQI